MDKLPLPEAPVTMFTNYKRTDGFEVSLTLRGDSLKEVATELDNAIKLIAEKGGTPVIRGFKKEVKPVEYVPNRLCGFDGGKLIYGIKKDGSRYIKCENNKFINGQQSGCKFVDWMNTPERQIDG
ncbi:MAG TPA: hypothetical protein VF974_07695 [Patescibacteria group bacterium]